MIPRLLDLSDYSNDSVFLFGPRQVGKTFLIKNTVSFDLFINLLRDEEFLRYANYPALLFEEIRSLKKEKLCIVIDEIQRLPKLLNEVHFIIEEISGCRFILTGSSARKLRREGVNLLGGRALKLSLHPLTYEEIKESSSFENILRFGTLPRIVTEEKEIYKIRRLKSYIETYLREEIQQESLVRHMPSFAKFLDLAAYENGNILNFQSLSREVGVHSKTIREYFSILEDTLLGFFLNPYTKSKRKKIVSHPRFFLFDLGVVHTLRKELERELVAGTPPYGKAFEHFIILEIKRLSDYRELEIEMSFFRTRDGAEVDLILEIRDQVWAVEIKSGKNPGLSGLRGLRSFLKDHKVDRALCVCQTPREFERGKIEFLPWQKFLKQL